MKTLLLILISLSILSCQSVPPPEPLTHKNSNLTHGNVQMHIATGVTTKAQILEVFGAPNVTTRDGEGQEVWTYQRQAQVNQAYDQFASWFIILTEHSSSASGFESSSRMITLVIKFNEEDIVSDFKSRASNF